MWLGRNRAGDRVALKVIPVHGEASATLLRVAQEASVAAVAAGEVGVAVHEVLDLGDCLVIVMELLEGGSLAGVLAARGHLSARECVTVLAPIAEGLARLHAQGIVHGDLTTGNIGFDGSGRPRLLDFGASRLAPEREPDIWGTTGFTAPEVAEGHGHAVGRNVGHVLGFQDRVAQERIRLAFALIGPLLLMAAFGYGISFDIEGLRYAVLDRDHSLESRAFLDQFSNSRYFV